VSEPMGFFTDTSVCIGCKACEVACKQWNDLPAQQGGIRALSGQSYDNTVALGGDTWRHVKFVEQFSEDRTKQRWLMMSDVCKHCVKAPCLDVCPTGAIIRTEFDTVVIQASACNGCRDCIPACPFGVIDIDPATSVAKKCTLCYDRMKVGMVPACAQACPTQSIQFGPIRELHEKADARLAQLTGNGSADARLYGRDDSILGGLNSFYLLLDEPEVYGLPRTAQLATRNLFLPSFLSAGAAVIAGFLAVLALRMRDLDKEAPGGG
jgi:formate dehydrogenase iron-sulfur subunit